MQELLDERLKMPESLEPCGARKPPEQAAPTDMPGGAPYPPKRPGAPCSPALPERPGMPCAPEPPAPCSPATPEPPAPCSAPEQRGLCGPRAPSAPCAPSAPEPIKPPGLLALLECLLAVWRGKRLWRRIKRENRADGDSCALVLMPQGDFELNACALRHLDGYLREKYLKRALVLTHDRAVLEAAAEPGAAPPGGGVQARLAPERDIGCICKYYCFAQFAKHIVVVSLDEPYGSDGLLAKKGCSLEDIVTGSMLGLH